MIIYLMTFLSVFFQTPSEHERINNRFSKQLTKNINQRWELVGGMDGGKFNPTLEIVSYNFDTLPNSCVINKDDARKIYIEVVEYLLNAYNKNLALRNNLSNFPFQHNNIQIIIYLTPNDGQFGEIESVKGFKDKVIFTYVTDDMSYVRDEETFEEAYFKVYGSQWDPFKYGCGKGLIKFSGRDNNLGISLSKRLHRIFS